MKTNNLIAQNIRKWREFKDLNQETLAKKLGITNSALSQIENCKIDISINRVAQIADTLELNISELFSDPQHKLVCCKIKMSVE